MQKFFKGWLLVVVWALAPSAPAHAGDAAVPRQLRVCGDQSEFAPYTYYTRAGASGAAAKRGAVSGYNVDFLAELLSPAGRAASITLLPWKRCLAMAAAGQFDMVLDAGDTQERRRAFLLAQAHYKITPVLLFHHDRPPGPVESAQEATALKRCEVLGWDYAGAGTPPQDDNVSRPATLAGALAMLRAGRCQVMIYNLELLQGLRQLGEDAGLDGIEHQPLPWVPSYRMHFAVSRKVRYAEPLLALLNQGIARLARTGAPERLLRRHLAH
jgi:ABC-type amino acid transport substrate-binding protein